MDKVGFICAFLLGGFSFAFFSCKLFSIHQQCGYKTSEFFTALFSGKKTEIWRLTTYSLIFCFLLAILNFVFYKGVFSEYFLPSLITTALSGWYFLSSHQLKRAVFTKRFVRISICATLIAGLTIAMGYLAFLNAFKGNELSIVALGFIPILSPIFIAVATVLNLPYDFLKYQISKAVCKRRLRANENLHVIGITGSMGKTSVKNYLLKMLSTTYKTLATPESYNTPLGVCKTVQGGVDGYEFFIVEMGARRYGDIKELCKMVAPSVGVITGIAEQHTQTLKGIQGVIKAKNQLIEGLLPNGFAVFSNETIGSKTLYEKAQVEKYRVGFDKENFVSAQNVIQRKDGLYFDLVIGGKPYQTFMPALGAHNVLNVCLATAVAVKLGVKVSKILSVIPTLTPPPHRAEIITTPSGVVVIDDGYNANLVGVSATAQAVKVFSGYKIAVTSGIVEVGTRTYEVNFQLGKTLAENFDEIIAVGINSQAILDGAKVGGAKFSQSKSTAMASESLKGRLKRGDLVAFFNDLPDKYDT